MDVYRGVDFPNCLPYTLFPLHLRRVGERNENKRAKELRPSLLPSFFPSLELLNWSLCSNEMGDLKTRARWRTPFSSEPPSPSTPISGAVNSLRRGKSQTERSVKKARIIWVDTKSHGSLLERIFFSTRLCETMPAARGNRRRNYRNLFTIVRVICTLGY